LLRDLSFAALISFIASNAPCWPKSLPVSGQRQRA
jgi:hypothetical protein